AGERRVEPAWRRQPADVGQPLAVAQRRRDTDRSYYERHPREFVAGAANADVVRPRAALELVPAHGRTRSLGAGRAVVAGRTVGGASDPEKPADRVRPQPAAQTGAP